MDTKKVTIEGVETELTPEQIRKIEAAKKPSPEQYLIDILNKMTGRVYQGKQVWYLDDQWVFEVNYENKILWCYYWKVWVVLYKEYSLNDNQVQQLMQDVVCKALNLEGFTPYNKMQTSKAKVCKALTLAI